MNRILNSLMLTAVITCFQFSLHAQSSDSLVNAAWKAWEKNDQKEVERLFLLAIGTDRHNSRAYLGLSQLYTLQEKKAEAWREFSNALDNMADKYPYIFSAWLTPKFRNNDDKEKAGIIALLESLTEESGAVRDMQAAACDELGEYFEKKHKPEKAKGYFEKENAICDWTLIGPFENISASGYEKVFPPENEYNPDSVYEGKSGTPAWWFKIPAIRNDRWIDLTHYFSYQDAVYYGNTFVYSPVHRRILLRIGTSGSLKAFLNDELILDCADENNNDLDTYNAETELQQGWNRLLIKCGYSEIAQCNFKVRITDTTGGEIQGLKISVLRQKYQSRPGAAVVKIPNFAEEFFKRKIDSSPDEMENYLLLADCFLRNDKATEAELVLLKAIQLHPNCSVFYDHILEAYSRGEKYDEMVQTYEKLSQLDPEIPIVLNYQIARCIQNEEYDDAEKYMGTLEKLQPESEYLFQHKIDFYSKKNYVDKLVETVDKAYAKYPLNWNFAYFKAYIASQLSHQLPSAVQIIEKYIQKRYDNTALYYLADFYLQSDDMQNWEKTYNELLGLQPSVPIHRYRMAEVYLKAQDLIKAERSISEAIRICPGSSTYWGKFGDILRMKGNVGGADSAYREALRLNQSNHDARESLRGLEGRGSIYTNFEPVDVHSLVENSPTPEKYPNDAAVYLLDDMRRVVYEHGASEFAREILIKVFNNRGIDVFKEYSIGYNSYNEKLNVDKAIVIKRDGSEIKADVNQNRIIFKSLEPNDCIHLKYRVRKLYSGRMAKHFWDSYHFNYYYPVKLLRYSLLVPDGTVFLHTTQNMPDSPVIKKTQDGTLYSWSVIDEPAVDEEPGMPQLTRIGKMLHVSSIGSWEEIVDWYADLAQTKTKSSYEIKEQVDSLLKNEAGLSDTQKAEKIYNYITEHIRYSSVPFRQSGLIPQKARNVLVTRIGDCKDVATLYIAMLRETGIRSYYTLVSTRDEEISRKILPSIMFNHCIVAVELPSGLHFCDLTAHYNSFNTLPENDIDGMYLLIKPGEKDIHYFDAKRFPPRNIRRTAVITLKEDNSAVIEKKYERFGSTSALYREAYQNKSRKDQEQELTSSLMRDFPSVRLLSFEVLDIDRKGPTTGLSFSCEVPQLMSEAGQYKILKIPWTDAFEKWPALSRESRSFPLQYWVDTDTIYEEITIRLPAGFTVIEGGTKSRLSNSVCDYAMELSLKNNIFKGWRRVVNKKTSVLPGEYKKFREFYNKVIAADSRHVLLKKRR